jgi:hypothetical protein
MGNGSQTREIEYFKRNAWFIFQTRSGIGGFCMVTLILYIGNSMILPGRIPEKEKYLRWCRIEKPV